MRKLIILLLIANTCLAQQGQFYRAQLAKFQVPALPSLNYSFMSGTLDPSITYTGNGGTRVNSSGQTVTVSSNVPRFDYNPVTLASNGILIEESKTNIFSNSSNFTAGSWTLYNASLTQNAAVSPSGNTDASKLTDNTSTNEHYIGIPSGINASGGNYTMSIYVKKAELEWLRFAMYDGSTGRNSWVNLTTGTVGTLASGTNMVIVPYGNGWYRVIYTAPFGNGTNNYIGIGGSTGDNINSWTGTNGGIYIWGAQLESGTGTSYIPTNGTTITRSADNLSIAKGSWWNNSEGTFIVGYLVNFTNTLSELYGYSDNGSNRFVVRAYDSGNLSTQLGDGVVVNSITKAVSFNTIYKTALSYTGMAQALAVNGTLVNSIMGGYMNMSTGNTFYLGSINSANYLNGYLRSLQYYKTSSTNAKLQSLSQ